MGVILTSYGRPGMILQVAPNELRWHVDFCLAFILDHLSLRRFSLANSAWLHSCGGRPAKVENWKDNSMISRKYIVIMNANNVPFANICNGKYIILTIPFSPGDYGRIDEWIGSLQAAIKPVTRRSYRHPRVRSLSHLDDWGPVVSEMPTTRWSSWIVSMIYAFL